MDGNAVSWCLEAHICLDIGQTKVYSHDHPVVGKLWAEMGAVADFTQLADRPEAARSFAHFESVEL